MKLHWDVATEALLVKQYLESVPAPRMAREEKKLLGTCQAFRSLFPGQSCLEHTHTTTWIPSWALTVSSQTARVAQIEALGRWWSWLFDREVLNDNVLACFYPRSQVLREGTVVILSHNLQRRIAHYLDEHGPRTRDARCDIRCRLQGFNLFLNRSEMRWDGAVDEQVVLGWFRSTCRGGARFIGLVAGTLSRFLDYLVEKGDLTKNPFRDLKARYGRRRLGDVLSAMLGRSSLMITPIPTQPRFVGPFASQLEAFVSLKRAMGLRYEAALCDLQRFDRFVASQPDVTDVITPELVDAWLASGPHLSPNTQKHRLGLVRQFCLYLARIRPETYVPGRTLFPVHIPLFKAYVYSPDEYRGLLRAALALPAVRSTLRPRTFYTALLLLYATGLRVGEALRLRLRDVDLDDRTILIRETKFFKTRVVPFPPSLAEALRSYLKERLVSATGPDAPFFINHEGRAYSTDKFSESFRTLLTAAGIPKEPRKHRPRVYDIRHTFALTRVLKWYREGADLQAKLPLLATYMGHVDVLSTQVYLTSTAELLREACRRFELKFGSVVTLPREVQHEL